MRFRASHAVRKVHGFLFFREGKQCAKKRIADEHHDGS